MKKMLYFILTLTKQTKKIMYSSSNYTNQYNREVTVFLHPNNIKLEV